MALKGGTGIRKVFIEDYRFSDDLDFTLLEPIEADALQSSVIDAMTRVRDESGIQFEDDIGFRQTRNGFKATTRFRILHRGTISPTKIDLDLTGTDSEQILLPVSERRIFHHYSDGLESSVTSYSLEEIIAEKIRSIFQRTRSRDIYDIDQLAGRVDRNMVQSIVHRKCELKQVEVDPGILLAKRDQFASLW
jgi:predicted nucleotidyltransferase component of viral defense system